MLPNAYIIYIFLVSNPALYLLFYDMNILISNSNHLPTSVLLYNEQICLDLQKTRMFCFNSEFSDTLQIFENP